jgi:hypothetical protein
MLMIILKVLLVVALGVGLFRLYKWWENGGLYYMNHPVAQEMDQMKSKDELANVDIESALLSIDVNASKSEQVNQFKAEIEKQKP